MKDINILEVSTKFTVLLSEQAWPHQTQKNIFQFRKIFGVKNFTVEKSSDCHLY